MNWIDILIVAIPLMFVMFMGWYSRRYVRSVADFLSAGRICGRYVICVADVANALSERDTGKCLSLLDDIAERTPQAMLSICVGRIRELLTVKALGRRPGAEPIEKVLGGQEWMYRNHRRYASSFSERELIEALGKAAECEKKMKSGSNPDLVLELWVAGVCTGVWAL